MIECKECGKPNSLDSRFCRACGAPLPEERLIEQQTANAELIAEGKKLLNEGRLDEARLVVQSALEANPSDPDAWALGGEVHEKAGGLAEALEAYEKVVQLREDSALDRIKVQHLRQLIAAKSIQAPSPTRRGPALVAALAAVVLVGSLGTAVALLQNGQASGPTAEPERRNQYASNLPQQPPTGPMNPPPTDASPTPPTSGSTQPQPNPTGANRDSGAGEPAMRTSPTGALPLPAFSGGTTNLGGDRPLPVNPPPNVRVTPERDPATASTAGPDPSLDRPDDQPPPDPGRIEIRPSQGGATSHGGSDTVPDRPNGNKAQALVQTARELFRLGKFPQAADAYEKAVSAGATDGVTLQRLAQCYERLGRNADAAGAYDRAIRAYEAEIRRSPSPRAQSGLEACRQALRLIQGA